MPRDLSGEIVETGGYRFAVELVRDGSGSGSAVSVRAADAANAADGCDPESAPEAVLLRSALIGHADLIRLDTTTGAPGETTPGPGTERHLLHRLPPGAPAEQQRAAVEDVRRRLPGLLAPAAAVAAGGREVPENCVNLLWWDERANFGDAVGPWLVRRLTGRTPVNGWRRNLADPPLVAVGSTAGWLEQDGTRVWGAGLMAPLAPAAAERLAGLRGIRIHAVRGELTGAELRSQLGWSVPEIYGDPALLLPRFLPVPDGQPSQGKVAVLPHLDHRGLLGDSDNRGGPGEDRVHVVDARQGLEQVVREVAGARACISSSLHGIIVAQAYGVPWVWVRIEDAVIAGDTFKFRDFFTTLEAAAVSAVSITAAQARTLDPVQLARTATLPRLQIALDALLEAFPLPVLQR
ncbi:polysaccharide pyruvyl transferase family protein [Arthrobacter sp. zg-Y820]|uniref:polysaccharide pyruvyl transferase family protein n=1 Tax=unclassified Arthrobacter TaxID=235627 RepID=UPI00253FDE8B|nr:MULTISPECIES: polysaccharide pyruvyl transferase family protein [unclassified Arthrobacter]MCC9196218.1 polysaccharide pyruvyl transferase family protein [Arthrobacter sp. zg-Y820]MDK1279079.1 polysaccharide pyruvyl transferase family protein [Arthrobacter sp. zg.Y820]WIB08513.1 polysaccharide pyruvyl transferase family protein [Arthrobacter sp. zg-Y820]